MTRPVTPARSHASRQLFRADLLRVLVAWPPGDALVTADDLADHLATRSALPRVGTLASVLSEARRRGWVTRRRTGVAPARYAVTPTGVAYRNASLGAAAEKAARQK